jgi:hypothetical protein
MNIKEILNRKWDPIGVLEDGVTDEYDYYVPQIATLMATGAGRDAIAELLGRIRVNEMKLPPNDKADQRVADLLLQYVQSASWGHEPDRQ